MKRICVTGPESTGKTTLSLQLGEFLSAPVVPEAARLYAERLKRELTVNDVLPIARACIALVSATVAAARDTVVFDTDLVSTVVYGRAYYGFSEAWLEREEQARRADLYLLCDVSIPWIADGIRDLPLNRAEMFDAFAAELQRIGANVVIISGTGDERRRQALAALRA